MQIYSIYIYIIYIYMCCPLHRGTLPSGSLRFSRQGTKAQEKPKASRLRKTNGDPDQNPVPKITQRRHAPHAIRLALSTTQLESVAFSQETQLSSGAPLQSCAHLPHASSTCEASPAVVTCQIVGYMYMIPLVYVYIYIYIYVCMCVYMI